MVKKGQQKEVTNEKIMGFLVEMDEKLSTLDERLTNTDGRLISLDKRLTNMDERITNMDERITNMDERAVDMGKRMATKDDLEQMKDEIIKPILKAIDKDAVTIYDHGKRIVVLEKKVGVITK